jgi:hypothetical protein
VVAAVEVLEMLARLLLSAHPGKGIDPPERADVERDLRQPEIVSGLVAHHGAARQRINR